MIKKLFSSMTLMGLLVFATESQAQLNINSAQFVIESGAVVTVQGNLTSNTNILGAGKILLKGTAAQSVDMNGFTIPNLEIDNTSNVNLSSSLVISTNLLFTNGLLQLGAKNLTIGGSATITNPAPGRFIVTNGAGYVKKNSLGTTPFNFPVGYSATEYNPITVSNAGTVDNYNIHADSRVYNDVGQTVPATTDFANAPWTITEDVAGGSNLSLTGTWSASDELLNFDRTKCGIAKLIAGPSWDLPASNVIAASGAGPYQRSRTGINTTGTFAVTDADKVNRANINLKVFLQGAYTGTGGGIAAGLMRDQLRANGVLPVAQPYSTGKFTQIGVQGGTETVAASVFNAAANTNNNIVDWVFVTLLDGASPTTKLQTRAALVQKDGDVVDLDGVSPLSIPIDGNTNYHISIGHRNHLSIRTPNASPLALTKDGTASWDFTTAANKAYADPAITSNPPMIAVTTSGTTKYCLIGGNTDGMTNTGANGKTVIYSGSGNDKLPIVTTGLSGNASSTLQITAANYLVMGNYDLNLNGSVVYSGSGNDPAIITAALGGNTSITAKEHQ